ncbi:hypothetical protein PAJ_p0167 (plasmid) [Pantoea ananatis AJ13355]|uniref:Lipoprotein n=1 Tax=Pantoea ananatis (strain AJ13355) TaxID=932677 RepID=A0A0H3L480_PANAA|nr:hypothetical protein PAJ_p0167 [Pantoea ananatis AJ13355]
MLSLLFRLMILTIMALTLAGCARSDALWAVTDNVCMVNYHYTGHPSPCQQIYIPEGKRQGFSIIQNPRYPYHFISGSHDSGIRY